MRRVVLATGNAGKLREMRAILEGHELEVIAQSELGIVPPPEDGDTFVANALIKARHAAAASGLPAIADDSGIEVDALDGRPGLYSARYRCAMVFVRGPDDPAPIVAEASWEGSIGFAPRGTNGFGYDPYVIVAGDDRTVAEMPEAEKNRVSHRGQALVALAAAMKLAGW